VLSKATYFKRLTLVLDNLSGVFAWLFVIHLVAYFRDFSVTSFYQHASLLAFIVPVQALAVYTNFSASMHLANNLSYLIKAFGSVLLAIFALVFAANLEFVSRWVVFGYGFLTITGLLACKSFLHYWYFHGRKEQSKNFTKILMVGAGPRAQEVAKALREDGIWGTEIIGFIDPDPSYAFEHRQETRNGAADNRPRENGGSVGNDPPIYALSDIGRVLAQNVVDEVMIALPRNMLSDVEGVVSTCEEEGIRTRLVANIFNISAARTNLSMLGPVPVLDFHLVAQNEGMLLVKRIFDIIVTVVALPFLVPLFGFVAIAVKLDSPGPAFFNQTRIGLNKRRFNMYKFRSMFEDAEAQMAEIEHLNEADGPNFKIKDDPRVTRVGKFIRKTSLDELPQLINVLFGDMSLVGPRPMSIRDVDLFDQGAQRRRFSVRPGCTCLWQISGRSNLSFDEWLELDLQYINNWSVLLDVKILLLTVPSLIKGDGAV
jgi:exopolysaccharide biosynthesis polyprenyl glycosylphosphotransferase